MMFAAGARVSKTLARNLILLLSSDCEQAPRRPLFELQSLTHVTKKPAFPVSVFGVFRRCN
jgi:hypothetical protein